MITVARFRVVEYKECPKKEEGSEGYVYLVKCNEFFKLGMTKDLKKRIGSLNASNPYGVELIAYFESQNAREDEKRLHKLMRKYHQRFEWYKLPKSKIKDLSWFVSSNPAPTVLVDPDESAAMMVLGLSAQQLHLLLGINPVDVQRLIESAEETLDANLCMLRGTARAYGYSEEWVQSNLADLRRIDNEGECRDACAESGNQVKKALD